MGRGDVTGTLGGGRYTWRHRNAFRIKSRMTRRRCDVAQGHIALGAHREALAPNVGSKRGGRGEGEGGGGGGGGGGGARGGHLGRPIKLKLRNSTGRKSVNYFNVHRYK